MQARRRAIRRTKTQPRQSAWQARYCQKEALGIHHYYCTASASGELRIVSGTAAVVPRMRGVDHERRCPTDVPSILTRLTWSPAFHTPGVCGGTIHDDCACSVFPPEVWKSRILDANPYCIITGGHLRLMSY